MFNTNQYAEFMGFPIFKNLSIQALPHVFQCLEASIKTYEKGEIIYRYHDEVEYAGVVMEGTVKATTINADGSEHNIRFFEKGVLFAEAFACVPHEKITLQVVAQKKCSILFLKLSKLTCKKAVACPYASQVTANVLGIIAQKNIFQVKKLHILNQKKIRDKLLSFLRDFEIHQDVITLPFNRQELADYMGVDRSALSREMSKMQREGIFKFCKNKVSILDESVFEDMGIMNPKG